MTIDYTRRPLQIACLNVDTDPCRHCRPAACSNCGTHGYFCEQGRTPFPALSDAVTLCGICEDMLFLAIEHSMMHSLVRGTLRIADFRTRDR